MARSGPGSGRALPAVVSPAQGRIGTLTLQSSLEPVDARVREQIIGTL